MIMKQFSTKSKSTPTLIKHNTIVDMMHFKNKEKTKQQIANVKVLGLGFSPHWSSNA